MTEYDFSPEAYERHLANQARIARWVDDTNSQSPENPFVPLPGNYDSVTTSTHPPTPYPQNYHAAAFVPHYANQHSPAQSPTPSYHSFDSSKQHKPKHGRHYSSPSHRSRSLQPSPHFGAVVLPVADGLYRTATQAQLAHPRSPPVRSPVRSSSTPIMGMPYYPETSQTSQSQHYAIQPSHYPNARSAMVGNQASINSPSLQRSIPHPQSPAYVRDHHYASPSHSPKSHPRSGPSSYHSPREPTSPAWTYSSLNASSVQSLLVSPSSAVPGVTFVQPNPHQPIVVPIQGGSGGYVVVPAAGQQVQVFSSPLPVQYPHPDEHAYYTSDEDHPKASFFGTLRLGKKRNTKLKSLHRQETKVKRGNN